MVNFRATRPIKLGLSVGVILLAIDDTREFDFDEMVEIDLFALEGLVECGALVEIEPEPEPEPDDIELAKSEKAEAEAKAAAEAEAAKKPAASKAKKPAAEK